MKKEKVIEIGVLLGIIILAVIVVVVAGNQRKNKTKTETENKTETETAPADKESLDADELVEENFRQAGITEYEKIDLQAYEKQADKLVKQLKKYQKDYEYVTFESNIHGDLRKTDVERIRKFFETGT